MEGTVKWFSSEKGYGFITSNSNEDHYFNVQSIVGASLPDIGDKVEFESKPGAKGPRANNIRITAKLPKSVRNHNQTDDRINCPSCKKKIVPRMITYKGEPDKSVCPYCAATVSTFGNSFSFYITVIAVIAFIVMIW